MEAKLAAAFFPGIDSRVAVMWCCAVRASLVLALVLQPECEVVLPNLGSSNIKTRVCCRAETVHTVQVFGMMVLLCVQVEAGAQVIITQLFYDVEKFIKFTQDCRALGIQCPIIPGQMTFKQKLLWSTATCLRCLNQSKSRGS